MKKNVLLKKAGALLLALSMSVAAFSTVAPEGKIIAKAVGTTPETAETIAPTSQWSGWIDFKHGEQYYKITLPKDGILKMSFTTENTSSLFVNIDGVEGGFNAGYGDSFPTTKVDYKVLSAGSYLVKLSIPYPYDGDHYKIKTDFQSFDTSENGDDSYENPKSFSVNQTVTDALTLTDKSDWYKVTINKDGKYTFRITNYGSNNFESETDGSFYNSMNEKQFNFWSGSGKGQNSNFVTSDLKAGVYYVIFTPNGGSKYSFTLSSEQSEQGKSDEVEAPKSVTINKTKITKVKSPKKKKAEVTFNAAEGASGYQIEYSTDKNFKKNVKSKTFKAEKTKDAGNNKRKVTISKLKRHKKYFFRIRTYVNNNNSKYYSGWSKAKKAKIK
ncbi:hypothetical protein [Butyrivibrio sp. FC2001]|uniref:hypothetical protein n=1 Tax=Butyrivibrio sp. FC2001 TaxID=1280671 RepID=UPI00056CE56C|nr:hypothetical protein [Butyrivibrio sp. FC2001]